MQDKPVDTKETNSSQNTNTEQFERIVDFAHKEIEFTRTAYKWLLSLTLIFIGVVAFFTYNSFESFKEDARKMMLLDLKKNTEELQNQNEKYKLDIKSQLDSIYKDIGQERGTRQDLKETIEYLMIVSSAQNDDRKAYDKLNLLGQERRYIFNKEAELAWLKIFDEHASPTFNISLKYPYADKSDLDKKSFDELKNIFKSSTPSYFRPALFHYIWEERNDIHKMDKMELVADILKNDESLRMVEYAGRIFAKETAQTVKPLDTQFMTVWWDNNKVKYKKSLKEDDNLK